jgi:oxygen-independent coproporphyrinogen-3 oxidase
MAGIYIHIPFCKQKCHYCNFFSVAGKRGMDRFTETLMREAELRKDFLEGETVATIYFGGGTPSLLNPLEIHNIIDKIRTLFAVSDDVEITLEANPDDITGDWLQALKLTPVNRLSIGVQSFDDEDLEKLNRVHSASQALSAIRSAREAGYENITADLIYGIPGLTPERWRENLRTFFSLDIPHLSAYALTVEPKTALDVLIRKGKYPPVDEELSVEHFRILLEATAAQGFVHYEISNFARPGHYSRHNSLYWLGGNYLGLGPSAHSFNGRSRQWNVSNISGYLSLSDYQTCVEETEILTPAQRYNEYVMTSLRTVWGCDTAHIENVFGRSSCDEFVKGAVKFEERRLLRREGSRFFLTDEGKLLADGIIADLFTE